MKTQNSLRFALLAIVIIFATNVRAQFDNQVSDCASVTPKGGIRLPSVKVGSSSTGTIVVKNTSSNNIVISEIDEDGGGYYEDFSIDKTALPLPLTPGESHTFICTYSPKAPITWNGETFAIYVVRFEGSELDTSVCHYINFSLRSDTLNAQSGVAVNNDATTFNVYPNPATEKVEVSLTKGYMNQVEVFDALGTTVSRTKNVQRWTWDLRTTSGSTAPSGVYFIRAVTSDAGSDHVMTKKVIVK